MSPTKYVSLTLLLVPCLLEAAPQYSISQISGFPGEDSTEAWSVNDQGQVIATSRNAGPSAGFLWQNGQATSLTISMSQAIVGPSKLNNAGQVVGNIVIPGQSRSGFLWQSGLLKALPVPTADLSNAMAINDQGNIAGGAMIAGRYHAIFWRNGIPTDISDVPGYDSWATAINNQGQILIENQPGSGQKPSPQAHWHLWDQGSLTEITDSFGTPAETNDINNFGQATGVSSRGPFIWKNGAMSYLPLLPGAIGGTGISINDSGQVVGYDVDDIHIGPYRPWLWDNGKLYDLQGLIPADSGWRLNFVTHISNTGLITGDGAFNGSEFGFLLTPTDIAPATAPEPGTFSWLALGGCFLLQRRATNSIERTTCPR